MIDDKRERDCNFVTDLTLGLVDTLRGMPGVQDLSVVVRAGVERAGVVAWEQRNNVTLPQPLKNFYAATDGFKLTWNYATAGKVVGLGNLELLPLGRVNRLGSGRGSGDPLAPSLTDLALAEDSTTSTTSSEPTAASSLGSSGLVTSCTPSPGFSSSLTLPAPPTFHASKMFEVDSCQGYGKVVLAYPGRGESFREGSYWFVDPSLRPHLLANDTHTYWRLVLAHLGMPQWQALVAGLGLTPWARQWYEVVASYLVEGPRPLRFATSHQDISPAARLDPAVFRTKRATHKSKHSKEQQAKEQAKAKDQVKDKLKDQPKEQHSKDKEHVKGDSKEKEAAKEQVITATREQVTVEHQNNETTKDQPTKDVCKDSPTDHQDTQETNNVNCTSQKEDDKTTEEKSDVKEDGNNKKE
ncbi:hypothetical protein Pmani_025081 [Petrolisthes manimaculis]|uniref:Tubulin polyglutamylase complex subunit 2 n=1 Tax=Petrolisthes manimaculis TaxID=1843537 RepID=A0AAE1TZA7_9EUCA|nr:hypothetical protein Pmani_025081 [Petrolisthes manimaculis]